MKTSSKTLFATCLACLYLVTVIGCGKSLSGVYSGDAMSVEFKDGGKATVTVLGSPVDATYAIDGKKVTVTPAGGNTPPITFTINDDNSLAGPDGSTLKKK